MMMEILCILQKDELEEELAEKLKESYDKYSTNNKTKKEIDEMHERVQLYFIYAKNNVAPRDSSIDVKTF